MLKIFNTLTNKKEVFRSIVPKTVNIYVCGVTVYDLCHIGHGRTFVVFDMIVRYLKFLGYNVQYIRNITDIDDKIIKKLFFHSQNHTDFTNYMIKEMDLDFSELNIIKPNQAPKVTKHINVIIKIIKKLLKKQHAYIANNGDVLFSIQSFPKYGCLSNQNLKKLQLGSRVAVNLNKKNPLDFIIWKRISPKVKSYLNNDIYWNSPWGEGRPGWHISCSAMIQHYFNDKVDIHGGGIDLLFPHHENENSQSYCINNRQSVRYWMHSGLLLVDNLKMSKSLDNYFTLKDVFRLYNPEILRFFYLSTHYRSPINYHKNSLKQAKLSLDCLSSVVQNLQINIDTSDFRNNLEKSFTLDFINAMNDDFNTPRALSVLFSLAKRIKKIRNKNLMEIKRLLFTLKSLGSVLGLFSNNVNSLHKKYNLDVKKIPYEKIKLLIKYRDIARNSKNWLKADSIRNKLLTLGVKLVDKKNKLF